MLMKIDLQAAPFGAREPVNKCPFCGSEDLQMIIMSYMPEDKGVFIECSSCGLRGSRAGTLHHACVNWNRLKADRILTIMEAEK